VLEQAAEDCQRWQRLGFPRLRMGVNLSMGQLARYCAERRAFDTRALRECCDFQFEVPAEELMHAPAAVMHVLQSLRKDGVDIAMQGFDAEDTVRTRLWSLPVDALKIGRGFIHRMTTNQDVEVVVSSMVVLARAFRLGLVAEGVEQLEQIELLAAMGCEHVQGFAYSPAVAASGFEVLLSGVICQPQQAEQRLVH
jgi:EAL domain-containing protein (putative c-di-GMP-specific phosphodiesterase class I)